MRPPREPRPERLPWPLAALPLDLPADWLTPGASRAQDARWAAVGNRVMSIPIFAMITQAAVRAIPGMASRRAAASAKGAISCSILTSRAAMSASIASTWPSIRVNRNA